MILLIPCCEPKTIEEIMNGNQNEVFLNKVSLNIPRYISSSRYGAIKLIVITKTIKEIPVQAGLHRSLVDSCHQTIAYRYLFEQTL